MNINFSINSNESSISSKRNTRLKPFEIHTVTFDGAEIKSGTSKAGNEFKLLQLTFSNKNGIAEPTIFWPDLERDGIREVRTAKDGHEYETPSRWEQTKTVISQTLETLSPEGFKKMQAASSKFKSFDDVVTAFIKITDPVKGKDTNLKLVGKTQKDGTVVAVLPKFVAISKTGEKFTCDNFVGDKLFFSAYEEKKKAEYANAKPTDMSNDIPAEINDIDKSPASSDDIDFDSLL